MVLEKPICSGEDKPHGFILPWMDPLKVALDKIALPSDLKIEVRRRPNTSATLPPGTYELKAGTVRKLYLPSATQEAIDRMRRRIEYAPAAYGKHGLAAITDMRLNAIFFGPPGTGKSSAFLDVTEGLIEQRLSVSLRGLVGGHLGDTERNLLELTNFVAQHARRPGRIALLLDDADDFCGARGDDNSAAGQTLNALKIGMLHLMDIAGNVPIILTTNRISSLDSAIHRRIVEHIEFPLPDGAARMSIISGFLETLHWSGDSLTAAELADIASASDGFSPAELALAVVDGLCEIESGKQVLFGDALQRSVRARSDMMPRTAQQRTFQLRSSRSAMMPIPSDGSGEGKRQAGEVDDLLRSARLDLHATRTQLEQRSAELAAEMARGEGLRRHVATMEASRFWRLRNVCLGVKRRLGLTKGV